MHVISVRAVLNGTVRRRWLEGLLLFGHGAGYLAVVFLVLSWPQALAFIAVQQGLFGLYLGCVFAPNHKGMPVLSEQDSLDFLRQQVLTSRNVSGGRLTETMLGGPQLPDRAPPVPGHAPPGAAPLPDGGAGLLRPGRPALLRERPGQLLL